MLNLNASLFSRNLIGAQAGSGNDAHSSRIKDDRIIQVLIAALSSDQ